jgi:hypothetical protein
VESTLFGWRKIKKKEKEKIGILGIQLEDMQI